MDQTLKDNIVLYWGHPVSVRLKNGECVEGILAPERSDDLVVDGHVLPCGQVSDLRMIGEARGVRCERHKQFRIFDPHSGREAHNFQLLGGDESGQDDCEPDFPRAKLFYGEFDCEVDFHVVLDHHNTRAKDVHCRQTRHAINLSCLENKVYLYRKRQEGYFPAILIRENGVSLLRRLSGETEPLVPEEIEDITRHPQTGDQVVVEMLDGSRHQGQVTACLSDFFMLELDKNAPRLFYAQVDRLRLLGRLYEATRTYNKKYCAHPDAQNLPQTASFVAGVGATGLVAKDVQPCGSETVAEAAPVSPLKRQLGLIVKAVGGYCYVGRRIDNLLGGNPVGDRAIFRREQLPADLNFNKYIYVVRYESVEPTGDTSNLPRAEAVAIAEELGPYEKRAYTSIRLDENDQIKTEPRFAKPLYDPLFALSSMDKKLVYIVCKGSRTCMGYLVNVGDETLTLSTRDPNDYVAPDTRAPVEITVEKDSIIEIRTFGRVTSFRSDRGFAFIDLIESGLYFHVRNMRGEGRQQNLLHDLSRRKVMVSFRLLPAAQPGFTIQADDVLCVEERSEQRFALVEADGSYRLAKTRADLFDRVKGEDTPLPTANQYWLPPKAQRPALCRLQLQVFRELSPKNRAHPSQVCRVTECEELFPLQCVELSKVDKGPKDEGMEYRYGIVEYPSPELQIFASVFACEQRHNQWLGWLPARQRSCVPCPDPDGSTHERIDRHLQESGMRTPLKSCRLLLVRYVQGKDARPNSLKVLWVSPQKSRRYQFAWLRDTRLLLAINNAPKVRDYLDEVNLLERYKLLLDLQDQFTDDPEMLSHFRTCCSSLLSDPAVEDEVKMRIRLERANTFLTIDKLEEAEIYYTDWLTAHSRLCREHPQAKATYASQLDRVKDRLKKFEPARAAIDLTTHFASLDNLDNNDLSDPELRAVLKNRDADMEDILGRLCENGNLTLSREPRWLILQGQWRVGKSTMLNLLKNRLRSDRTCVIGVTLVNKQVPDYEAHFASKTLLKPLRTALEKAARRQTEGGLWSRGKALLDTYCPPDQEVAALDDLSEQLNEFVAALREIDPQVRFLFLIDEFSRVYTALKRGTADPGFLTNWATFALGTDMAFVTAGGEFIQEMMDYFARNAYQKASVKTLNYMDKTTIEAFLRYVIDENSNGDDGREFDNTSYLGRKDLLKPTIELLYKLTQGNAFLLIRVCESIIYFIKKEGNLNVWRYITPDLVLEAVHDYARTPEYAGSRWFGPLYDPYSIGELDNNGLTFLDDQGVATDNLAILKAIVEHADPVTHDCPERALAPALPDMPKERLCRRLDKLKARRVVTCTSDGDSPTLRIRVDLFYEMERHCAESADFI